MILDLMKNFENIRRTKNNRKKTKNNKNCLMEKIRTTKEEQHKLKTISLLK